MSSGHPLVVILLGPTAVGKTATAIQLAQSLHGEVVSADSRLLYRGMDIGTAKPTVSEQGGVPHHLIDVADPDETWSLRTYQLAAFQAIETAMAADHLPIVVGGTGQYVRALTEGWRIPPQPPIPGLRATLENIAADLGPAQLHERLAAIDPAAAANIDPNNVRRTVRAMEVILGSGKRFSEQRRRIPLPYRYCQIGLTLPRDQLYARIDRRIDHMLDQGLVAEIQTLLDAGYSPDLPAMSAIGYREIASHLQGEISMEEAIVRMRRRTRQFVRRQANWFKPADPEIFWLVADEFAVDRAVEFIRSLLDDG